MGGLQGACGVGLGVAGMRAQRLQQWWRMEQQWVVCRGGGMGRGVDQSGTAQRRT